MDKTISDSVTKAAIALFTRRQWGHMGDVAYLNGGGKLFGDFTQQNNDYYVFRSEVSHIAYNAKSIANDIADTEHLIVVGQGPALSLKSKEMQLIKLLPKIKKVTFVDISQGFNDQAVAVIDEYKRNSGRQFDTGALTMEYNKAAAHVDNHSMPTTVISTGSLISNVHNAPIHGFPEHPLKEMLQGFSDLAGPDGKVVLGYDSNDDEISLRRAYNAQLAPFIKNIAKIIADHGEGIKGFNGGADHFDYEMSWDHKSLQVMHKLIVRKSQAFTIEYQGRVHPITLRTGEEFVVMSSIKPRTNIMSRIAEDADVGLVTQNVYQDRHGMVEHVFTKRPQPPHHH
jgi:hypothetical protein